jgi:hypothetical protein
MDGPALQTASSGTCLLSEGRRPPAMRLWPQTARYIAKKNKNKIKGGLGGSKKYGTVVCVACSAAKESRCALVRQQAAARRQDLSCMLMLLSR